MASGETAGKPRRNPSASARARAERHALKARGKPLLESPGLFLWVLIADALFVHGLWLLARVDYFQSVLAHFGVMSAVTFLLFALDKWRAKRQKRRVSEMNLLMFSAIGGAAGGILAMVLFSHKTRGLKFRVGVPVFLFMHLVIALAVRFSLPEAGG